MEHLANNATTSLVASISPTTTTIAVHDVSSFPSPVFRILIDTEIMKVVDVDPDAKTLTVVRGEESAVAAHTQNATVACIVSAAGFTAMIADAVNGLGTPNGAVSTVLDEDLPPNMAIVSDGDGKIAASNVTTTELNTLSGITTNIQDQLAERAELGGDVNFNAVSAYSANVQQNMNVGGSLNTDDGSFRTDGNGNTNIDGTLRVRDSVNFDNGAFTSDGSGNVSATSFSGALNFGDITNPPTIPANTSELTNDSGFITATDIPTDVSAFTNDAGYITLGDVPTIPTIQQTDTILIGDNSGNALGSYAFPLDASDTAQIINAGGVTIPSTGNLLAGDGSGGVIDSGFGSVPTATSELTNDSGYITSADIPAIPTATSQLTNDSGFITSADIPAIPTIQTTDTILIGDNAGNAVGSYNFPLDASDTAQIINAGGVSNPSTGNLLAGDGSGGVIDSGYGSVPTATSELTNDSGFITAADIPAIPTNTSQLTNDSGFITSADIPTIPTIQTTDTILIGDNAGNAVGSYNFPLDASNSSQIINAATFDQDLNTTNSVLFADVQTKGGKYVAYTDANTVTSQAIPIFGDTTGQPLVDSGFVFPLDASDTAQIINASGVTIPSTGNLLAGDGAGGIIDSGIGAVGSIAGTTNILVGDGSGNAIDSGKVFPLDAADSSTISLWPSDQLPTEFTPHNRSGNTWTFYFYESSDPVSDYQVFADGSLIGTFAHGPGLISSSFCTNVVGTFDIGLRGRFGFFKSPFVTFSADTEESNFDTATGGVPYTNVSNDPSVEGNFIATATNPQNITLNALDQYSADNSTFFASFVGSTTDRNAGDRIIFDDGYGTHIEVGIHSVTNNGDGTWTVATWLHQDIVIPPSVAVYRRAHL